MNQNSTNPILEYFRVINMYLNLIINQINYSLFDKFLKVGLVTIFFIKNNVIAT